MKEVQATRERKEAITAHFLGGGTAATLPDELKRVPAGAITACEVRAREQRHRRQKVQVTQS